MNKAIHDLMNFFNLEDVWREHHPSENMYSWFGPNGKMGRLDYFLVSSDLAFYVQTPGYDAGYKSDHSLCHIRISFDEKQRGRGTWKFNSSLLHDKEYINLVKRSIKEVIDEYKVTNRGENEDANPINPRDVTF
jgi:hypothetical protein